MRIRTPKGIDLVVVIHLYYYDMLEDLAVRLDKLRELTDFDVAVSIPYEHEQHIETIANRLDAFIVEPMENRGKDVLPFIKMLEHVHDFRFGLKLHTKRKDAPWTLYNNDICWRDTVWDCLLNLDRAKHALDALRYDTRIYAPHELWLRDFSFLEHELEAYFASNHECMKRLSQLVDVKITNKTFIVGNMFWFEIKVLKWLRDYDLDPLFINEDKEDGQMEHAFERMWHFMSWKRT
jgi:hypothetical protein